jgi:hypothetical protein
MALPLVALAQPAEITGSLETVNGLRVLKLWGSAEERGYAHGRLVGADLVAMFEDLVLDERIAGSPQHYQAKVRGELLPRFRFGPDYRAELEGMLRGIVDAVGMDGIRLERLGRNLDVRDLMAVNSLADWAPFACSSFSAWGEATEGGEMITARNLDYAALPGLDSTHLVIVYLEPGSGKLPWVSVAWPGLIGAYTAMNSEGVTISMHDSTPLQPLTAGACVPRSFALREGIETARAGTAVADVKRVLLKSLAMMGNNIHVSSPYTGQKDPAAVFEYDGHLQTDGGVTTRVSRARPLPCWIVCTNHYCQRTRPPPPADGAPGASPNRYRTVASNLKAAVRSHAKIDRSWALKTLGEVAAQGRGLTLHTVVFYPNRKEMYVYLARAGVPAPMSQPVHVAVGELLRR